MTSLELTECSGCFVLMLPALLGFVVTNCGWRGTWNRENIV